MIVNCDKLQYIDAPDDGCVNHRTMVHRDPDMVVYMISTRTTRIAVSDHVIDRDKWEAIVSDDRQYVHGYEYLCDISTTPSNLNYLTRVIETVEYWREDFKDIVSSRVREFDAEEHCPWRDEDDCDSDGPCSYCGSTTGHGAHPWMTTNEEDMDKIDPPLTANEEVPPAQPSTTPNESYDIPLTQPPLTPTQIIRIDPDSGYPHHTYCPCSGNWSLCCDNPDNYEPVTKKAKYDDENHHDDCPPCECKKCREKLEEKIEKWKEGSDGVCFCTGCNVFIGWCNPRQYCRKVACYDLGIWHEYENVDHARKTSGEPVLVQTRTIFD